MTNMERMVNAFDIVQTGYFAKSKCFPNDSFSLNQLF